MAVGLRIRKLRMGNALSDKGLWTYCRVCPLMPALRSTLQLPDDAERLDKLTAALAALSTDPDADVAAAARAVTGEFQSKPVRRQKEAPAGADAAFAAFEAADKKKAAEESDMSMSADEIERCASLYCMHAATQTWRLCHAAVCVEAEALPQRCF